MADNSSTEIEQLDWVAIPANLGDGLQRNVPSKRQLRTWLLVLQSQRIPCRIEAVDGYKQLVVPTAYYQNALQELKQYEEQNRNWPPPPVPPVDLKQNHATTLWVLTTLIVFHYFTQHNISFFSSQTIDWINRGSAHAEKILGGEWWRVITALTLHSGTIHLFGNVAIGGVIISRLCQMFGSGLAFFLVLITGIMGNGLNALLQSPDHRSIGASTAVFGAIALLATCNTLHYRHSLKRRWPIPLAAALGLLALLGVGDSNTDIGAHLLGFISGIILACCSVFFKNGFYVSNQANNTCGALSILIVLTAWWLA